MAKWDERLLNQTFREDDVKLIRSLPIHAEMEDILGWHFDSKVSLWNQPTRCIGRWCKEHYNLAALVDQRGSRRRDCFGCGGRREIDGGGREKESRPGSGIHCSCKCWQTETTRALRESELLSESTVRLSTGSDRSMMCWKSNSDGAYFLMSGWGRWDMLYGITKELLGELEQEVSLFFRAPFTLNF